MRRRRAAALLMARLAEPRHRFGPVPLMIRARMSALTAALTVMLVAACGSDTNFITGDEYRAMTAPMPTDAAGMRRDLSTIQATLSTARVRQDGKASEAQAAACNRLFDLMQEMREGFARYDLSQEAFRLVSVAYSDCDEAPAAAARRIQEALSAPPRPTSEPSSG